MPVNKRRLALSLALAAAVIAPFFTNSIFEIGPAETSIETGERDAFFRERGVNPYSCVITSYVLSHGKGDNRSAAERGREDAACRDAQGITDFKMVPVSWAWSLIPVLMHAALGAFAAYALVFAVPFIAQRYLRWLTSAPVLATKPAKRVINRPERKLARMMIRIGILITVVILLGSKAPEKAITYLAKSVHCVANFGHFDDTCFPENSN